MKRRVISFFLLLLAFAAILSFLVSLQFGSVTGNFVNTKTDNFNEGSIDSSLSGFLIGIVLIGIVFGLAVKMIIRNHNSQDNVVSIGHEKKLIPIEVG